MLEYKSSCSKENFDFLQRSTLQTHLTKDPFIIAYMLTLHKIHFVKYFGRVIKAWGDTLLDKASTSEIDK